jgi:hypothetical protein
MIKYIIKIIVIAPFLIAFGENENEYIESVPGTDEKVEMV